MCKSLVQKAFAVRSMYHTVPFCIILYHFVSFHSRGCVYVLCLRNVCLTYLSLQVPALCLAASLVSCCQPCVLLPALCPAARLVSCCQPRVLLPASCPAASPARPRLFARGEQVLDKQFACWGVSISWSHCITRSLCQCV